MEMALLIENNGRKERKVEENRERRKVSNYNKIKFALKFSFSFRSQINISLFIVKIDTFVLLLPANLLVWIFFANMEKVEEIWWKKFLDFPRNSESDLYKNYIWVEFQFEKSF